MRRTRAEESSATPAIPSPNQALPTVAHAGQSGGRQDTLGRVEDIKPKRKGQGVGGGPKPNPKIYLRDRTAFDKAREKRDEPTIRYGIPSVAKHCARVIVMHHMDYPNAVRYLLGANSANANIDKIADELEKSTTVQKYVEEELSVHGLDEMSKDAFVREMWDWLRRGTENKSMKAAGILGKGFIAEKVEAVKPEELPIEGLGDAVRSMLGTPSPTSRKDEKQNAATANTDDIQVAEQSPSDTRGPVLDPARPEPPAH
jgi:hypothetical protein